ncbi:MBL fold metallo-hydrolase [Metabacillus arenae]|uniref:MBL fold metallo-hydrolase n=1 Tax=Metabacillus arenae TaxID=2771434 RepID=A0A926NG59_9BACI|nr:MBL fold metallo-hydrolase [Metabacillus arenae]MBD1380681.1 MBL fold metallo-hydrolase [Metabacillus arenae]
MKVTVVGYWGGFPGKNEATSGYLFESGGYHLLVDCGSAVLSQLQNYIEPEKLDAVILSHDHHDHTADIGPLQFARLIATYLGKSTTQLPIYAHQNSGLLTELTYKQATVGHTYYPAKSLQIGPFQITFLLTKHPVECYAMRISDGKHTIVYTADSSYKEEFVPFTKGADLLLCECNFYGDQDGSSAGHMNSVNAATIAQKAGAGQLILTHLPHYGDINQLVTEAGEIFKGSIQLAQSGLTWGKE